MDSRTLCLNNMKQLQGRGGSFWAFVDVDSAGVEGTEALVRDGLPAMVSRTLVSASHIIISQISAVILTTNNDASVSQGRYGWGEAAGEGIVCGMLVTGCAGTCSPFAVDGCSAWLCVILAESSASAADVDANVELLWVAVGSVELNAKEITSRAARGAASGFADRSVP